MPRKLTYAQAINEAIDQCMTQDPFVYIMGLGVPDPKGIFGTTLGLQEKHGADRVMNMPASENAMTGVAIGSALVGMRPILTHQRVDFVLLSMDQIVNQASKWHYMFDGKAKVPLVIRMIVGRGWGQGAQHSQNLHALFAHVPGLKVVMPSNPYDAKGLLIASVEDDNPVIFIEHRWLHNVSGDVPEEMYRVPIGKAKIVREGSRATIVATSYMVLESLRAAEMLAKRRIEAEVIDVRTLKPLDETTILDSVRKTGRLVVADTGWKTGGFGAEIVARIAGKVQLKFPPHRIGLPDCPTPTSMALTKHYYPRAIHIGNAVARMLWDFPLHEDSVPSHFDIPDKDFTPPF